MHLGHVELKGIPGLQRPAFAASQRSRVGPRRHQGLGGLVAKVFGTDFGRLRLRRRSLAGRSRSGSFGLRARALWLSIGRGWFGPSLAPRHFGPMYSQESARVAMRSRQSYALVR